MDPKVAQLVMQQVERARLTIEGDLNKQEPSQTPPARFAENLLSVDQQRELLKASRDGAAPDILTSDETKHIAAALRAVKDASQNSDEGSGLIDRVAGLFKDSSQAAGRDALEGLLDALTQAAADDLGDGGKYEVVVTSDGLRVDGEYSSGKHATFQASIEEPEEPAQQTATGQDGQRSAPAGD